MIKVGVTRMYRDVAEEIGIENYSVIDPYNTRLKNEYSLLIISRGYREKVKRLNPFPIFEISSATFDDLINSVKGLARLNLGSPEKIERYLLTIEERKNYIKSLDVKRDVEVNPLSHFLEKVVLDLNIPVSREGIPLVPDYMADRYRGKKAFILKTHKYHLNTLERVEDRYLSLINLLNSFSGDNLDL